MAASLVAEGAQKASHLAIPPLAWAIIALAIFGFLLILTYAFENVWHRHS